MRFLFQSNSSKKISSTTQILSQSQHEVSDSYVEQSRLGQKAIELLSGCSAINNAVISCGMG
jgi:hypothetical protein